MGKILDTLVLVAPAIYFTSRVSTDPSDTLNRTLIGGVTGTVAALKGPELYQASKNYVNKAGDSKLDSNKVLGILGGAAIGYLASNYLDKDKNGSIGSIGSKDS